jgi:hypothetical protein
MVAKPGSSQREIKVADADGGAAKQVPHLLLRICRTIRTIFPEYGWGEAEPLTR